MEFDTSKDFIYMEDNNDGTVTITMNLPETLKHIEALELPDDEEMDFGETLMTAVMEFGFKEMVMAMLGMTDEEAFQKAATLSFTIIPNTPEDL